MSFLPVSLPVPPSTKQHLTLLGLMILLAVLDFAGAILAKEWTLKHDHRYFLAGIGAFLLLFCVYALSLHHADLSLVTIGWIVFLQVGLVAADRFAFGVAFAPRQWIAILLILLLQAYLVVTPNGEGS